MPGNIPTFTNNTEGMEKMLAVDPEKCIQITHFSLFFRSFLPSSECN
jgi:hypothetical protein